MIKSYGMRLETPKGFRDFLPEAALRRQLVLEKMTNVLSLYGFDPLETPAIEFAETLKGKYGEEEKLIFEFIDRGGRQVALRYDQTVPLARVIAQYPNIPKPFKRYQIQNVWRAESPQKGRFREFLQVDFDIVGSSSLLADAEIVEIITKVLGNLGIKQFQVLINSRKLLVELLQKAGVPENLVPGTIASVDKLKKIGVDGVTAQLKKRGLDEQKVKNLIDSFQNAQPNSEIKELFKIFNLLGVRPLNYRFEPTLARGLDYYTGLIFETEIRGYSAGSVCSGGRYDKLLGQYSGSDLPATGASFGFDRLLEAMQEQNILPEKKTRTQALITVFSSDLLPKSLEVSSKLRSANINTEVYLETEAKLDKQLKYADNKGIPFAVIIGPDEASKSLATLKNLTTQEQKQISIEKLISELSN